MVFSFFLSLFYFFCGEKCVLLNSNFKGTDDLFPGVGSGIKFLDL